ncbi:hypothetical protein MMC07_000866 [Pseudocyphellaria aurata]|nr:hypothetical protein [Pseudocyphellaria aurata]
MTAIEINVGIICGCLPALSALFQRYHFKRAHTSTLQSSAAQDMRRFRATVVDITTPRPYRKPNHRENSHIQLYQMSEDVIGEQGDLMASRRTTHSTDEPTPINSDLSRTMQTKTDDPKGPFKKIRGMMKWKSSPSLADLTNNTSLGVQIERSLARLDSERNIGLASFH